MKNRQQYAAGFLEALLWQFKMPLVPSEGQHKQAGRSPLPVAQPPQGFALSLCKDECENMWLKNKTPQAMGPIRHQEERKAKPRTPVAITSTLGERSSSPTSKGSTRKGPHGEEGAKCRHHQPALLTCRHRFQSVLTWTLGTALSAQPAHITSVPTASKLLSRPPSVLSSPGLKCLEAIP